MFGSLLECSNLFVLVFMMFELVIVSILHTTFFVAVQ